jgi:hypothetical protein
LTKFKKKSETENVNCKKLVSYRPSSVVMYSDASNIACGAYSVEIESKVFHKMFNDFESIQTSTWREMRAVFSFRGIHCISIDIECFVQIEKIE